MSEDLTKRVLLTERLKLRAHRPTDLSALLAYYSMPEVVRYTPFEPWDRSAADEQMGKRMSRRFIKKSGDAFGWVVEHEDAVVGDVVVWACDDNVSLGEIGWAFHPEHQGRGLATEAVGAVLDFAFRDLRFHRVRAEVDLLNTASWRLCERVGMVREGCLRQDYWSKGAWTDNLIYGSLAVEWLASRSQ